MRKMSELKDRLKHGGAYKKGNHFYCSIHLNTQLNQDGECADCIATDRVVGAEYREANAMQKAQRSYEDDL